MEVARLSSNVAASREQLLVWASVEATVVDVILAAQRTLFCLLLLTGSLLNHVDRIPDLTNKRFPIDELRILEKPGPENKDASDTEDDDEDDEDANDQEDDAGDEDFSGGEEGGDDEEGDPEEDPEANGNEGSDDDDDDDDDDEDNDGDEAGDEEEEDEEEEDEDQPPAKKRK